MARWTAVTDFVSRSVVKHARILHFVKSCMYKIDLLVYHVG